MDMRSLVGKVIQFNQNVLKTDIDFSPGQRAFVIGVGEKEDGVTRIDVDFSKFEEENKLLAEHVYFNDKGEAALAWHETKYYPANKKTYFHVEENEDVFEVDERSTVLREWEATTWVNPSCPGITIRKTRDGQYDIFPVLHGCPVAFSSLEEAVEAVASAQAKVSKRAKTTLKDVAKMLAEGKLTKES